MNTFTRKTFLEKVIGATVATAFAENTLANHHFVNKSVSVSNSGANPLHSKPAASGSKATDFAIHTDAIVDLHCHPSLKMYLWNKKIWKRHCPKPGDNPFAMQCDLHELSSGYVKGLLCAHYLVEAGQKRWDLLKKLYGFLSTLLPNLSGKIEHEDFSNFTQVNIMIDKLEMQIHEVNKRQKKIQFVIARNFLEFENATKKGDIPIAHSIEGGHALGRLEPLSPERMALRKTALKLRPEPAINRNDSSLHIRNLLALKARGVCLLTLSHFFENDLVYPVEGISPDAKKTIGMDWEYIPERDDHPLRSIGIDVVNKMLEIGMIVDLTHSTPAARRDVFCINKKRQSPRPLVFTHTGSQEVFDKYNQGHHPNFKYYCLSNEEIYSISEFKGIIGIIPENFWLVGANTHLKEFDPDLFRNGIGFMIETIKDINSKTKLQDYSNIGIGTDFDGLADVPADFYKPSQGGALLTELHKAFTPAQVHMMTSGNALRVLRDGWG